MIDYINLCKVNEAHGAEIEEAVQRTIRSGWYLQGREVNAFEKEYAEFIGTRFAIGVANGLDALILMLLALIETGRLYPGDEVIVPANTYIATILAISETGLAPRLVEPDPVSMQIDPDKIEEAINPRTKALMIVHLYGRCAWNEKIEQIVNRNNLILLEDNAQAHGCLINGRRTGSLGIAAAHSFYPGKNLGAMGDGGAVTTDDEDLAKTIRALANYGSEKKYVFRYKGRNSRLDEIQAAILRVKMRHLDADNDKRRWVATKYYESISHPDIILPPTPDMRANVFHIFPILSHRRDELQKYLSERGIQTLIHYPIPPHRQECYLEWSHLSFPITESIHDRELSLPMSPVLSDGEVSTVIETINKF